jgi:hypothetical protein
MRLCAPAFVLRKTIRQTSQSKRTNMRFKILISTLAFTALTAPALATDGYVPEIGSAGSLAALTAVAGIAVILWERRRRT